MLVVATAGITAQGAIDDLAGIAAAGRSRDAWVHVDAAWAGAALLHPRHRPLFTGIEHADSATIDPHKWLSVPMGAGLFLARDWGAARHRLLCRHQLRAVEIARTSRRLCPLGAMVAPLHRREAVYRARSARPHRLSRVDRSQYRRGGSA